MFKSLQWNLQEEKKHDRPPLEPVFGLGYFFTKKWLQIAANVPPVHASCEEIPFQCHFNARLLTVFIQKLMFCIWYGHFLLLFLYSVRQHRPKTQKEGILNWNDTFYWIPFDMSNSHLNHVLMSKESLLGRVWTGRANTSGHVSNVFRQT